MWPGSGKNWQVNYLTLKIRVYLRKNGDGSIISTAEIKNARHWHYRSHMPDSLEKKKNNAKRRNKKFKWAVGLYQQYEGGCINLIGTV